MNGNTTPTQENCREKSNTLRARKKRPKRNVPKTNENQY